ncbi:MAG: MotA/TolQ/ExbB proton channel family protein [Leptospiraceae bacterium]|nr:MotA/TolQ/ExbB proton channel family protein [Leptospiraceae bacterium]MCP5511085.1 MotA/TolQ/ExbB proton channel family protein [Leptospiraceae bacterium]
MLLEYLHAGGSGMYFLVLISIACLSLVINLLFSLFLYQKALQSGSLTKTMDLNSWEDAYFLLDRRIDWLGNLAGISTLTGLLGTVIGIFSAFQEMQTVKQASIEVFASGISQALLTTILGLLIAVPSTLSMHIFRHYLEHLDWKIQKLLVPKEIKT